LADYCSNRHRDRRLSLALAYQRSTKETAFVRTGFGGEKVVVSGGAFVIPVLHDITPVNMTVMRIEVERRETQALITKNRMRVDEIAEFFVKVGSSGEAVSSAVQTLAAGLSSRMELGICWKVALLRLSGRSPHK
jgi:uncharacterized membrane protein YqiK